ncbi:MAG: cyclic nucleotide-binding domain-containing protein, partial [Myxococcota bacterium]
IIEEQPALPQASPEVSALPPQLPPPPQAFCEHEDGERAEPVDLEEEPKEQLPAPPDPSSPPSPPDSSPPPPPPQAFTDAARPPSTEAASRAPEDAPPSVIDLKRPAPKKPPVTSLRGNLVRLALSRSPLFRMLPEERRLDIAGRFEERRVQAGEAVLAPGQVTLGLYVLLEGRVRITVREGGEAALLAELERGALFGCVAALTGMPTLASAVCLEDGLLSVLPHRAFNELVEIHPELPGLLRREDLLIAPTVFVGERRGAAGA